MKYMLVVMTKFINSVLIIFNKNLDHFYIIVNTYYVKIMDLINQINLGNNFMRYIEPINRLIQTYSNGNQKIQQLQAFLYTKKIERFLVRKGVLSSRTLDLNTLCRGCSNHTTFVGLLYLEGNKSEKVCTDYKI